jgi:non-lysosomal glucosylceramidase
VDRVYTGSSLDTIAFPLGGIGTGTISLGGRGNLRDWEIFNAPGKNVTGTTASFLLRAVVDGTDAPYCRVLERRTFPPYVDRVGNSDGGGMPGAWFAGLPRFPDATFHGTYPLAQVDLIDDDAPVRVALKAYNPMVPLDSEASGIPLVRLEWLLTNPGDLPVSCTVMAVLRNPLRRLGAGPSRLTNLERAADGLTGVLMSAAADDPATCGSLALTTPAPAAIAHASLRRGGWFDRWHLLWDEFVAAGRLSTAIAGDPEVSTDDAADLDACLLVDVRLAPGETAVVPVTLTWLMPTRRRESLGFAALSDPTRLGNWYGARWSDAWAVAAETEPRLADLRAATTTFRDALWSSSLPPAVIDAVSSQMSTIRTNTCVRLDDGTLHAFEGCGDAVGCCPLDCSHVWTYEQSLAHLYPDLERSMRDTDLFRNTRDSGDMAFRTVLPLVEPGPRAVLDDTGRLAFGPTADGQMGTVLKVYREWLRSGDRDWLEQRWPSVRRLLEFAWTSWDADRDGLMEGEQHNTYDIEFYGPNTMTGSLYLAALRAGEEMGRFLGDDSAAASYREVFESGSALSSELLWNGSWFVQRIPDPATLDLPEARLAPDGSIKYQYGDGCLADQLLGQWFAYVVGLGPLYDESQVRTAYGSIVRHNFRRDLGDHANVQRVYALPGEPGTLLCTWPAGGRPALPFVYADEVWTGIEYAVAAGCIYAGLVDEGLELVEAVRSRHAGWNRNPWNEYECGHHYARAMSSWSLLLALSGYHYSAADAALSFDPKLDVDPFRCLFTTGGAWGTFERSTTGARVDVLGGELTLSRLTVGNAVHVFDPPRVLGNADTVTM